MDSGILNSQSLFDSLASQPKVEFTHISDNYSFNEDLICKYSLINHAGCEDDRIAIFKLGWNYVKDYVLFEWIPRDGNNFVIFNRLCLPRSTQEIYQFCYITGENSVLGASEPFQFCDKPKNYLSQYLKDITFPANSKSISNNFSMLSPNIGMEDSYQETQKLKDENEFLRNALKAVVSEKPRNYDADIQQLNKITSDLQQSLHIQQMRIRDLYIKVGNYRLENKKLEDENKTLQRSCMILKQQIDKLPLDKRPLDFDLGELQSLPPFPFAK